jgi:hypothetical protein
MYTFNLQLLNIVTYVCMVRVTVLSVILTVEFSTLKSLNRISWTSSVPSALIVPFVARVKVYSPPSVPTVPLVASFNIGPDV